MGTELDVRQMAAAPLRGERKATDTNKPKNMTDTNKPKNILYRIFGSVTFKLPSKSESFKNDDGSSTRRLAHVLIGLVGTEMSIRASVYERIGQDDKGPFTETYLAMPASGKGFPQPVFVTEDAETLEQYNQWRVSVVTDLYKPWAGAHQKAGHVTSTSARVIERPTA